MPNPMIDGENLPLLKLLCRDRESLVQPIDANDLEVMEVTIPMLLFRECATGFGQLNTEDHPNLAEHYTLLLQFMTYIHHTPSRLGLSDSENWSRLFIEKVVHRDDVSQVVGIRVRLLLKCLKRMGEVLSDLFEFNAKQKQVSKFKHIKKRT